MAEKPRKTEETFTPKMNPKRLGACQKFDLKNYIDDDFQILTSTPVDEDKYTPPPMSVFDVSKLRMLTSSDETVKTPRKRKCITEEYDPENDAFINDKIKVKFDNDSLKSKINHLMQTADVPAYKEAISNCFKKKSEEVKKRRTYKKETVKLEPEVELDPADDIGDNPRYASTPPGALRAMLYAKHFFDRVIGMRKYLVPLVGSDSSNTTDRNGKTRPSHALGAPEQSCNCRKSESGECIGEDKPTCSSTSSEIPQVSHHRVVESEILKGVVAYVDTVCHDDADISCAIRKQLLMLGAEVVPTFTKKDPVSLVLFSDGHFSTYKKAKKRGIPLVSVLWIEECRRSGTKAPLSPFLPRGIEQYECPEFVKKIKKRKLLFSVDRLVPRKQRKRLRKTEVPKKDEEPTSSITIPEYTPWRETPAPEWVSNYNNGSESMRILVNMTGIEEDEFKVMMNEPNDSEKYEESPLPVRLLHKLARSLNSSVEASSDKEMTPCSSSIECSLGNSKSVCNNVLTTFVGDKLCEDVEDTSECLEKNARMNEKEIAHNVLESHGSNYNLMKSKESEVTSVTPTGRPTLPRKSKLNSCKILYH